MNSGEIARALLEELFGVENHVDGIPWVDEYDEYSPRSGYIFYG